MFEKSQMRTKKRIEVELYLDDGSHFLGTFVLGQGERLSDILNDNRGFLPFEASEGQVVMIRKTTIAKVVQLNQHIDQADVPDPYAVPEGARVLAMRA